MKDSNIKHGYVYILVSKNCECIKIGGSDYPPLKRIKEINAIEPYKSLGKWELYDYRQVQDWRKVEYQLHYQFRSKLNHTQQEQRELFHLTPQKASESLNNIDEKLIIYKPKIDRMFNDVEFRDYLENLFIFSGLTHWILYQGLWTLVLFPSTKGGRYFTLNIGSHEVAFTTLNKVNTPSEHMILLDRLIMDYDDIFHWLKKHNGYITDSNYKSALPRSVCIYFTGDFKTSLEFIRLDGVRRALIAYWQEALFTLKDSKKQSIYNRFHNYNAVITLLQSIEKR
ncbi:GIY-YIG nuclease family protein [Pasteurella multocida]|uniref:GIY-YIG nuclease family protein n=1 Tax=Pasteurella multocida TaxID=747 RepID=UPI0016875728|nr:GIY-YIG nuclease family protein [Pasteurella multocida]